MNFEIKQTKDAKLVHQIMTHEDVFSGITTNLVPHPDDFKVDTAALVADPRFRFYEVLVEGKVAGLFMFIENDVHTMLLKSCRGADAVAVGKAMAKKFFEDTGFKSITSKAYLQRPEVLFFAKRVGFRRIGEPRPSMDYVGDIRMTEVELILEK